MERRNFLKGALAIFGVAAVGLASTKSAEAANLDAVKDTPKLPEADVAEAATKTADAQGQYYYRRRWRPRRRVYYYRPRRVYYRRPVYYYRRPVYYRRIYW